VLRGTPYRCQLPRSAALVVHPQRHLNRTPAGVLLRRVIYQLRMRVYFRLIAQELRVSSYDRIALCTGRATTSLRSMESSADVDRLAPAFRPSLSRRDSSRVADDGGHPLSLATHFRHGPLQITIESRILTHVSR